MNIIFGNGNCSCNANSEKIRKNSLPIAPTQPPKPEA